MTEDECRRYEISQSMSMSKHQSRKIILMTILQFISRTYVSFLQSDKNYSFHIDMNTSVCLLGIPGSVKADPGLSAFTKEMSRNIKSISALHGPEDENGQLSINGSFCRSTPFHSWRRVSECVKLTVKQSNMQITSRQTPTSNR